MVDDWLKSRAEDLLPTYRDRRLRYRHPGGHFDNVWRGW